VISKWETFGTAETQGRIVGSGFQKSILEFWGLIETLIFYDESVTKRYFFRYPVCEGRVTPSPLTWRSCQVNEEVGSRSRRSVELAFHITEFASSVTRVRVIVRAFTTFVCPSEVSLRRTALAKAQRDDRLLLRIHGTEKEMDREG
jgi:hypothetical protein